MVVLYQIPLCNDCKSRMRVLHDVTHLANATHINIYLILPISKRLILFRICTCLVTIFLWTSERTPSKYVILYQMQKMMRHRKIIINIVSNNRWSFLTLCVYSISNSNSIDSYNILIEIVQIVIKYLLKTEFLLVVWATSIN